MTSLLVADELAEAYSALEEKDEGGDGASADGDGAGAAAHERDETLASIMESRASRIETIADGLDQP